MSSYIIKVLVSCLLLPVMGIPITKSIEFLLPQKNSRFRKFLLLIGGGLLCSMVIFVGDPGNLPPTMFFFLVCVLFSCSGTFLTKITIGFMFASVALSFNAIIDEYYLRSHSYPFIPRILFWVLVYVLMRHHAPEKDYSLSNSLWRLLLFLTSIPLIIVTTIVLFTDPNMPMRTDSTIINLILLFASLLSFLGLLQTIIVLARQQKLERQTAYMNINRHYYTALEQQHFEVRRLKHDMSNHLQTLHALSDSEKGDYIRKLLNTPALTQSIRYCSDPAINAVLNSKIGKIEQQNIALKMNLNISDTLPFEKMDTCAVFANALDNAIEYCCKLPASKRKIDLESHVKKGLFVLKIKNPMQNTDAAVKKNMLPGTTKSNIREHGFGLKSIQETVSRYAGHMEIQTENNEFLLFLYMPLNQL